MKAQAQITEMIEILEIDEKGRVRIGTPSGSIWLNVGDAFELTLRATFEN